MRKWRTIVVTMLSLALLAGCSGAKPESTVEEFFAAGQQLDTEAMAATVLSTNEEEVTEPEELLTDDSNEYLLEYFKTNAEKMTYEVTKSEIDDDKAVVTMNAKYVDGAPLITATFSSVFMKMLPLAFSGTEMTEDETNQMFADTMKEQAEIVSETFKETTLKINLVKEDNEWYITEITDEMMDVVMSGFMSLSTELDSAFEETEPLDETSTEESASTSSIVGKRSNPVPLGQAIEIPVEYSNEDWTENYEGTISLQVNGITKGQAALDTLMAENQFNEAPPEGMEWVIFDVALKLLDGNQDTPYTTFPSFDIISSSGSEIAQDAYGTLNGNEFGYTDLFPGAEASGRVVKYAPIGDNFLISYTEGFSASYYFSSAQ
ncbi:uncharacterized protein DUF4878 [Trichococcus patagoniensis]|uniref:Uncharacterized protein DUF4878 n=1 Tax=Trichococcus patagoniensis TaxID=382641 RepID=A0A2T5IKY1_9LACT|nr:DUF4878 domain-containing protein [Trichococcus patagoniensis]PTQ84486.1 uncharacterized protein DUF4878 [Trichococcus patagoniensis]